jgi:hypothetical protein
MLTIKLEEVPEDSNITKLKLVYKLKLLPNGSFEKYKARIAVKGYMQEYGVDCTGIFSPKPQISGIRFVLTFILHHHLERISGDVSGTLLNAKLKKICIWHHQKDFCFKDQTQCN